MTVRLHFSAISRAFGRLRVVADVSGKVAGGGVLRVAGGNGSGKSTLLRILAGLLQPDRGTVELVVDGSCLDLAQRRRAIGLVAPDLALYEELTVAENLAFFARLRRLPTSRTQAVLDRLDLPPQRAVGALSSGMRQRLRWGWALLHQPAALLLDEPFQNLDPRGEALARSFLDEHLAAGGLAVIATPVDLALPAVTATVALGGVPAQSEPRGRR